MAIVRIVALGLSLIVAAGIDADCAFASTVTVNTGKIPGVHVTLPKSKVVTKNGQGHGTKTGQSPSK